MVELEALPERARDLLALDAGARRLAVIEMAAVNGLALVPRERLDVWRASSYGTGELILAAKRLDVDAILLGVGGSATSDLGLGALAALGLELSSAEGEVQSPPLPVLWPRVLHIAGAIGAGLPPLRIACDVESPVLGPHGAAAVYGPQKGLVAEDLSRFEAEARRLAALLCKHLGVGAEQLTRPGAGAAGGIAFGLSAALGARLVSGSALVAAWLGLDERLRAADWVLTGEGRFDESSGSGKGPGAVVARARAAGRPCVVFAGSISPGLAAAAGDARCQLVAITEPGTPLERAMAETEQNLERSVEAWLRSLDGEQPPTEPPPAVEPQRLTRFRSRKDKAAVSWQHGGLRARTRAVRARGPLHGNQREMGLSTLGTIPALRSLRERSHRPCG